MFSATFQRAADADRFLRASAIWINPACYIQTETLPSHPRPRTWRDSMICWTARGSRVVRRRLP
jgi:hypothetical protein